jgi:hypothetical protein
VLAVVVLLVVGTDVAVTVEVLAATDVDVVAPGAVVLVVVLDVDPGCVLDVVLAPACVVLVVVVPCIVDVVVAPGCVVLVVE